MTKHQTARQIAKDLVKCYFKNDAGEPFEMTDGQSDIFLLIFTRKYPRNQVIASTRYGKSEVVAMALILRTMTFRESFAIVSGQKDKAMIIMNKVIQHTFDSEQLYRQLELDKDVPLERLKRERSKDHITWIGGGGIKVFTANSKNKQAVKQALTGFGSANIIEDEASLVPDDVQAMVMRMLGDQKDNFILKIGNPFYNNHFRKTWQSSKYKKIFIDYKQAIAEGRYSESFIEEMREMPFFDILYENKFPSEDEYIAGGYRKLVPTELLEQAFIDQPLEVGELKKLGCDFAGGGNDKSAYVFRTDKFAKLLSTNKIADTMQQVNIIQGYKEEHEIDDCDISIDYGGIGQGTGDRLHELGIEVNRVMFGQSSSEKERYKNERAAMYHRAFQWLKNGGKLVRDDGFYELTAVNYKEDSSSRFQIQPKEELKKIMKELGIEGTSPDIADAFVLTFADSSLNYGDNDIFIV